MPRARDDPRGMRGALPPHPPEVMQSPRLGRSRGGATPKTRPQRMQAGPTSPARGPDPPLFFPFDERGRRKVPRLRRRSDRRHPDLANAAPPEPPSPGPSGPPSRRSLPRRTIRRRRISPPGSPPGRDDKSRCGLPEWQLTAGPGRRSHMINLIAIKTYVQTIAMVRHLHRAWRSHRWEVVRGPRRSPLRAGRAKPGPDDLSDNGEGDPSWRRSWPMKRRPARSWPTA
jgi:hypothetical protein